MLSALDYGHIEIDQCLEGVIPVLESILPWGTGNDNSRPARFANAPATLSRRIVKPAFTDDGFEDGEIVVLFS